MCASPCVDFGLTLSNLHFGNLILVVKVHDVGRVHDLRAHLKVAFRELKHLGIMSLFLLVIELFLYFKLFKLLDDHRGVVDYVI